MSRAIEFVVAYDITDDKERDKVADVLKDFGFRVQKSVFECRIVKSDLDVLMRRLEKLNLKTGFVKIYRIHKNSKKYIIGNNPGSIDDDTIFIV